MQTVREAHQELFHYTTAAGLSGILSTGVLWATHFSFTNDDQEYRLFFDERLPVILRSAVERAYRTLSTHPYVVHEVRKLGSVAAYKQTQYAHLLPIFRKFGSELNTPYMACFCTAETSLVTEHGLLSQWRGYGSDGGYALVFETEGVERLLREDAHDLRGMEIFFGDVEYYDDAALSQGVYPETREQMSVVVDAITDFLTSGNPSAVEPMFSPLHRLASMTKHWGFREEREVRLVISQPHQSLVSKFPEEHRLKQIRHFVRDGMPVPYIAMFDSSDRPAQGRLPLRRVVVGPHPNSKARKLSVELLLRQSGYDVPVITSAIPYRGR